MSSPTFKCLIAAASLTFTSISSLLAEEEGTIERYRRTLGRVADQSPLVSAEVAQVGCPKDGQIGPQAAPKLASRRRVLIPQESAGKLAYYSMEAKGRGGVLAPAGWACHGLYGSNGDVLIVQPPGAPGDPREASHAGPFVTRSFSDGSTSGRFQVAEVAGRLFPAARAFVDQVKAEGLGGSGYSSTPWPRDRITYLASNIVAYETPAGARGLGRQGEGPYAPEPVQGAVVYGVSAEDDPYLLQLRVRLGPASSGVSSAIVIGFLDGVRPSAAANLPPTAGAPASRDDPGAVEAVRAFYAALGRADGDGASRRVVPERRASGPFAPASISRFYGSLAEPLRLLDVRPSGSGTAEVRYWYRKPNGSPCDGRAIVTTVRAGASSLIARIAPLSAC